MTDLRGRIAASLLSMLFAGLLVMAPALAAGEAKPATAPAPQAAPAQAAPQPPAAPTSPAPPAAKLTLSLSALLTDDGPPIKAGLVWRVFAENGSGDSEATMKLVATSAGGDAEFQLDPGTYIVHAAFGRAGATTKIDLQKIDPNKPQRAETLILNAGGVKLNALLTGDIAIPADKLTFDVYARDADSGGERQALVIGAAANSVIRLNADTYQVVSHYGTVNATVRAEVHVQPGKLTEATLYQKAAEITLKLVSETGGEALTNVDWQVLTPSGVQVAESEGTFAQMVLAEGDYSVVAKHKDQVYTRNFSVESGYNREIELQAIKAASGAPGMAPLK
jgi:hypothetical protein